MTKGGAADSSVGVWHVLARAGMHGVLSIVNHCGNDGTHFHIHATPRTSSSLERSVQVIELPPLTHPTH